VTEPHVLTLSCSDAHGIVHAVSGFLVDEDCNITESQQHGAHGRFFLRVGFTGEAAGMRERFLPLAERFAMQWQLVEAGSRTRLLVLVSRLGHCLNDLLYRSSVGALRADVVGVVSNHPDLAPVAARAGVPYHHVPVTPETKDAAERQLLEIVAAEHVDLVVLARYMQILSPRICDALPGRVINIHHSLLPSFAGADPYGQAYAHGVKLVGATAHYVVSELDAGPIIEQDVAHVDHTFDRDRLAATGRDVEALVLARAVRWHTEHRVIVSDGRTVVFRG